MRPLFHTLLLSTLLPGLLNAQRPRSTAVPPRITEGRASVNAGTGAGVLNVLTAPAPTARQLSRAQLQSMATTLYPVVGLEIQPVTTAHLTASTPANQTLAGVNTYGASTNLAMFDTPYDKQGDYWQLVFRKGESPGGAISIHFKLGALKTPTLVSCLVSSGQGLNLRLRQMGGSKPNLFSDLKTTATSQHIAVLFDPADGRDQLVIENASTYIAARVRYCDITPIK